MKVPRKIRTDIIEANRAELEAFGPLWRERLQTGGRPATVYWLNEEQALDVAALSRAPKAAAVRSMLIRCFTAWRRGELVSAKPQFAIPQTMAEALRLAADSIERADKAEATLIEVKPKVDAYDRFMDAMVSGSVFTLGGISS